MPGGGLGYLLAGQLRAVVDALERLSRRRALSALPPGRSLKQSALSRSSTVASTKYAMVCSLPPKPGTSRPTASTMSATFPGTFVRGYGMRTRPMRPTPAAGSRRLGRECACQGLELDLPLV